MEELKVLQPYLWSFACLLFGYLLGNRFALNRDKRKEYNDAVIPLRERLITSAFVNKNIIDNLKIKLGDKANKIVGAYENEYLPAWKLRTDNGGYDDRGNVQPPIDENVINGNIEKQKQAKENLLNLCKLR
ncbi:hypothetical protein [Thalassotalea marina]|uniref:Uncharacterized protein n=1 Tax=Thalassotalea marina TaxID=1673741 RepID=A0A919EGU1_9GAMM|nr:hypothetical protein [Thalassotalea marina]GHF78096.1 hypothetical protein GCM10017161_01420 [Thalassotalea marina]